MHMIAGRLKRISFASMALLMLTLVVATIVTEIYGAPTATRHIYHSPWFIMLWALLAISGMAYIITNSKRRSLISLHLSLIFILFGAFVSFTTSQRGELILHAEAVPSSMFATDNDELEKIPFRLQLEKIDTCYTKNRRGIKDYKVDITISDRDNHKERYTSSLNNPINKDGYSLCIKGIDEGSVSFIVSHDPWGRPLSYTGYILTLVSFVILMFDKKSELSTLLKRRRFGNSYKYPVVATVTIIIVISRIKVFTGDDVQPILRTPLLIAHVSAIIAAYALIGYTALSSMYALFSNKEKMGKAATTGRILLYPATILLTVGIFIGAVWADAAWGRYWGWDPKEVWALLTLLTCSITFHTRSLPFIAKPRNFHLFSILISIIMLFTYFGVNYLLSGLHSYA